MRLFLIFNLALCFSFAAKAQEEAVKLSINQMFDGMRASNVEMVREVFVEEPSMFSISLLADSTQISKGSLEKFLEALGKAERGSWDERISFNNIDIDGQLASVWTNYAFYYNGEYHHCGVNSFHLVEKKGKWKIFQLADTRRTEDCPELGN
ncbi:MAG: nuclear transport factor 2 family protein [Bacteroidota bacterium]